MGVKPIKPLGEVIVGVEDGLEVLSEFPMGFRVNSAERWLLEGAVHSFDLAIGTRLMWLVRRCSMPCSRQTRSSISNR